MTIKRWIISKGNEVHITIRVIPRANKNAIDGIYGECLKIRLKAPPVDGKANKELICYLAEILQIPKGSISITSGETGRVKIICINNITEDEIQKRLLGKR